MTMGFPTVGAILITGVNSVLLVVLTAIWINNYRRFRSQMVLGLVGFSLVLLIENLIAIYFFVSSMRMLYATDPLVGQVVVGMRVLELIAISVLTYVTLK
jgi:hypothetical protein